MKKNLLILAVAAVALASCSNDETVQSVANSDANAISFRPLNNGVTRAADITGFTDTDFKVRADKSSDPYFAETVFSYDGVSAWTSTDKYYWPSDDADLTFYAYAPTTSSQFTHTSGTNTFVVTPSATAAEQVDLVYATATGKKSTHSAGVTLTFGHTESKVVIKLKNSNPNLKITTDNVVIGNVKGSGTYTMGSGWSSLGDATSYTQDFGFGATSSATQAGDAMILIPQEITKATAYASASAGAEFTGPYIAVDLKIQNSTSPFAYIVGASSGVNEYVRALFPLPTITWALGTKYVYTVDLAGGGYYTTNQDSNADLDPILEGAEIKFISVTVSDWAAYDGDGDGDADADGDSNNTNDPIEVGM